MKDPYFTEREKQVLSLIKRGYTTRQIAELLYISYSTAKNHIQSLLRKSNTHTRIQLIIFDEQASRNPAIWIIQFCRVNKINLNEEQESIIHAAFVIPTTPDL